MSILGSGGEGCSGVEYPPSGKTNGHGISMMGMRYLFIITVLTISVVCQASVYNKDLPSLDQAFDGDPVNLSTGLYVRTDEDLFVPGKPEIRLTRTYRNRDSQSRTFGIGALHPYDVYLVGDATKFSYNQLILEDGGRIHFDRISPGHGYADGVFEHTKTPTKYYHSRLRWNGDGWVIELRDGSVYGFSGCGGFFEPRACRMLWYRDSDGDILRVKRDRSGNAVSISNASGSIELSYDKHNRVTDARYHSGNFITWVNYSYDAPGRLIEVKKTTLDLFSLTNQVMARIMGHPPPNEFGRWEDWEEYTYDDLHQMVIAMEPMYFMINQYDEGGRVIRQILIDRSEFRFDYQLNDDGKILRTDVTQRNGDVRRVNFNSSGYTLSDIYQLGTPQEKAVTYVREEGSQTILRITVECVSRGQKIIMDKTVNSNQNHNEIEKQLLAKCDHD